MFLVFKSSVCTSLSIDLCIMKPVAFYCNSLRDCRHYLLDIKNQLQEKFERVTWFKVISDQIRWTRLDECIPLFFILKNDSNTEKRTITIPVHK